MGLSKSSVDWSNLESVTTYAKNLGAKTPLIIFHNGRNYQVTTVDAEDHARARGNKIIAIVNPK